MIRSISGMIGYRIQATDGEAGRVDDFFFDDEKWTVRYCVDRIAEKFGREEVLITPSGFDGSPDWRRRIFPLSMDREKVRNSPDIDTDKPVSRQKEQELLAYYGAPMYWQYYSSQTIPPVPVTPPFSEDLLEKPPGGEEAGNVHLHSVREVIGYTVKAVDGRIGALRDLFIDDTTWAVRYLAVDTNTWLPGGNVLVARDQTDGVSWEDQEISVRLTMARLAHAPAYDPGRPITREYENRLRDYYGRAAG